MHREHPPLPVYHPAYGYLGACTPEKGFVPPKNHWWSTRLIIKDSDRRLIRLIRRLEHHPDLRDQRGSIGNYDAIVSARGSGAMQDVWMSMTATQTPVTTVWSDLMNFASWQPMTAPSITGFTAGTGGAVMDATSNGSWLSNPQGSNKKYIVSLGLTINSVAGFSLAILYDCLWAGQYVITNSATTITVTTPIKVTRWASYTPGNADYAGGNQMQMTLASTLTITTAGTLTTTYHNQAGTGSRTTIWVPGPTGALINRIVGNTTYNTATVITSTPFMPLTNNGDSGVTSVDQVATSSNSISAGTINHKIVRPLMVVPFIAASSFIEEDATLNLGNMVELHNVSQVCGCLGWDVFSAGTTAASIGALLRMVEG